MKVLGIDPGLNHTGWAIISAHNSSIAFIASGSISAKNKMATSNISLRLHYIYQELKEIIKLYNPNSVSIEETFINDDFKGSLRLGYARGVALMVPSIFNLEVFEYAPNTIKKTVAGNGHASKEQIKSMIEFMMPKIQETSKDAIDAIAIALCHIYHSKI